MNEPGASSAPASMRSHRSETVAGFGSGIAEAAVLADETDRMLLIIGAVGHGHLPGAARLVVGPGAALARPTVDWAYRGLAEMASYAGVSDLQPAARAA